jgi:adenosylcobinamide kinase / adenosylcobinamide-phosphate guanylyltransferase
MLPPSSLATVTHSGSPLTVARPCRIPTGFPRNANRALFARKHRVPCGEAVRVTTLILGPVRSGKSARAQLLAQAGGKRVIFAATAANDPDDTEMRERIARHRKERPATWTTVETAGPNGTSLETVLRDAPADACVVVDALGTWLSDQLLAWPDSTDGDAVAAEAALDARGVALAEALAACAAEVILVAEETGWGVVPATPLGRVFRDVLGRLSRRIAARADRVELVVAGFAVDLAAIGRPVGQG